MDVVGRVGILGATSPLGKAFTSLLLEHKVQLCAGYRDPRHVPDAWWSSPRLECVEANVNSPAAFGAFEDCAVIVWLTHRRQGMVGEQEIQLNVEPFQRWCNHLASSACSQIIFVSSGGSVYGEPTLVPIPEDHTRRSQSPYGRAKKRMEDALWAWGAKTGKATAVLRPGNFYGPDSITGRSKGIVSSFLRCMYTQAPFTLIGNGEAVRDYIHVDDVSRALLHAIGSRQQHIVWNVGTGVGHASSAVIALIHERMWDEWPPLTRIPARETDVSKNILCNDRILNEAGWRYRIRLEEGITSILQESDKYLSRNKG